MTKEIEHAVWFDANTERNPIASVRDSIEEVIAFTASRLDVATGKIKYQILRPDDERVPDVPKWLGGIPKAQPRLLVATAPVTGPALKQALPDLVGDLDPRDLKLLRDITKRAWAKHFPHQPPFTDAECDTMINAMGMETVMQSLGQLKKEELNRPLVLVEK